MRLSYVFLYVVIIFIFGCSKSGGGGTTDPCAGITVTVAGSTTNPSAGSNNGTINVSATGGSSPFSFSLNGGAFQSSGNFTGLGAGSYTVTAKSSAGCSGTGTFTLTALNICTGVNIVVSATTVNPTSASATNGSLTASATGSTGFSFSLNGGAFQTGGSFLNLAAGTYTVVAKDANGCTGSGQFILTAVNACAGVTISLNATVTGNRPCELVPNGSISLTASGGITPYTFNLNGGAFQASNNFTGLGAASYLVSAKDANGCTGSSNVTVTNLVAGPLFLAVKTVIQQNCITCHNNTLSEGGMNWEVDCNIVQFKDRIRERAVLGNPSAMPPTGLIPASERTKITNWINAGGRFTD